MITFQMNVTAQLTKGGFVYHMKKKSCFAYTKCITDDSFVWSAINLVPFAT